jgi:hypothetical protein
MQHKIIKLTLTFVLLFSLQGFSQATEKSEHPLLDKYYPRNTDTPKAVTTQINPVPETKPAPTITNTVVPATPVTPTAPVMPATAEPADVPTVISSATTPTETVKPAISTTTSINKPTIVTPNIPTQKISSQPPPPPYRDTRLGSSTKQYDTWEKNNNGAGSVTTSPKG